MNCLGAFPGRENREQIIAEYQRKKYCKGVGPEDPPNAGYTSHGVKFLACPGNFWDWEALFWIQNWWAMQRGTQVFKGAMYDEPAKLLDIFQLIDSLEADKRAIEKKERERDLKNGKRSQNRRSAGHRRG